MHQVPPGIIHGEPGTESPNLAVGVRLRRGITQAKNKIQSAWATARLGENITWDTEVSFNFVKVITSEQVDAMMEKVRSIPGAGKIVFTPEFNEKYAELQERPKPYLLLAVEPNLLRVTGRSSSRSNTSSSRRTLPTVAGPSIFSRR